MDRAAATVAAGSVFHRLAVARLVSTGLWRWLRRVQAVTCGDAGSRSRLSSLHRRSASTGFSIASMPQRTLGMK